MSEVGQVRPETPADVAAIDDVLKSAFPEFDEADLVARLRANEHLSFSLVAELAGRIVGHVAFSPLTIGAHRGMGLAPLAVVEEHRRRGIGASLVNEGIAACRRDGVPFVVVLGEAAYYSRFGFRPASVYGVSGEFGGGDNFAIIELIPRSIPPGGGLARYASEFDVFRDPAVS